MDDKKKLLFVSKTSKIYALFFIVGLIAASASGFVHEFGHTVTALILGAEIDWGNWVTIQGGYLLATGISGLSAEEDQIMRLGGGLFTFLVFGLISVLIFWKGRRIPEKNLFTFVFAVIALTHLIFGILEGYFPVIYDLFL